MQHLTDSSPAFSQSTDSGFPILTAQLRLTWILFVAATITTELVPMPDMSRPYQYVVWSLELLCFGLVGFLAPLAFERFNVLLRGLILGTITATGVEVLQGSMAEGRGFHVHELLIKLLIIFVGFCVAIVARYERAISLGPLHIRLRVPQVCTMTSAG